MEPLKVLIEKGMQVIRGRIVNIGEDGKLQVRLDSGGQRITCDFLQTSHGPLPRLYLGTQVVCLADDDHGYVLGVVVPYRLPPEQTQAPRELTFRASENIELTCGESHLSMSRDGKIVLRGANITTRASEQNKIKGATISLN
jgi:hypothetical protein